ncbi:MAG: Polysaccharide biosynthesis protein, partial [Lacunisphaera sp.]|nr:Polysaccharide biosynthesis protein [Lacunisphaera sp.]
LSGFRWSASNRQLAMLFAPLVAVIFAGWYLLPPAGSVILGAVVTVPAAFYSLKALCTMIPMNRLPRPAQKLARVFRLHPVGSNP